MTFTFDDAAARRVLEALDPDDLPRIWLESPARSIDDLFCELLDHLTRPDGHDILLYPLIHENDRDGMIVMVHRPYPAPGLSISMEWNDLVPGPRDEYLDKDLTVDQVLAVVREIVRYGNDLLDREHAVAQKEAS